MYVIGLQPPSSMSLPSLLSSSSSSLCYHHCHHHCHCHCHHHWHYCYLPNPGSLSPAQVFYFFTFDINAKLSTSSQAAKVTKHTQNSQERWRTTKDMANERRSIILLRMTSADSFRQICFPWSGFFHLFSCLLLCLPLNWVQPPQFYSHSPDALVYLFPSLLLGTSTASLLYYAE